MPIFLRGLALKNYCGFGEKFEKVSPFKTCNFFIGSNNSGKSTVLNFISRHLHGMKGLPTGAIPLQLDPLEVHLGASREEVSVQIPLSALAIGDHLIGQIPNDRERQSAQTLVAMVLSTLAEGELVWIEPPANGQRGGRWSFVNELYIRKIDQHSLVRLYGALNPNRGGSITIEQCIESILSRAIPSEAFVVPNCALIPAIRAIGADDGAAFDHSGRGLISALANLQNPGLDERNKVQQFKEINDFLRTVTDEPTARIEIPFDKKHVLVQIGEKLLPLQSLGTGIHEVVMLAAFCTLLTDSIVCIEEPEIHLHPILQRKLIRYLLRKTNNQYFIATHSAAFIDTPGAAVFHVSNRNGTTVLTEAVLPNQRFSICQDLGYRASDLVQSNAIVWVEGPSDRIYIRHWLNAIAPDLSEGIHYSVMFYGGRLLSHLSVADQEVNDFIALRRLNRHLAIVIDSDKKSAHSHINDTKKRVLKEFDQDGGVGWLTIGREIENYIEPTQLHEVIKDIYADRYGGPVDVGQYAHALHFVETAAIRSRKVTEPSVYKDVDKVKLARKICELPANLDVLDLRKRVTSLAEMIRLANN